jgi:hypothetical protein
MTADRTGAAVWVYGVADGSIDGLPPCVGVDGRHDAAVIRHAGLAAIVSDVPLATYNVDTLRVTLEDVDRLERMARAHQRVLDAALMLAPVIPFRFCTIYATHDHVAEMLAAARPRLEEALARLRDTAEWGLKAYLQRGGSRCVKTVVDTPRSGTAYLARKREARADADAERRAIVAALDTIHAGLRAHAVEALVRPPEHRSLSPQEGDMVLNAVYLVADDTLEAFRSAFRELVQRYASEGLSLAITGPWPAYHFVSSRELVA